MMDHKNVSGENVTPVGNSSQSTHVKTARTTWEISWKVDLRQKCFTDGLLC